MSPKLGSRVAVIIPTYNRYGYLREAITSVLNQTRPADEVIVVDDFSSDETPQIAHEFPQVTYYRKPNEGLSAARNFGSQRTTCDLLVFLDDDDRLLPRSLELQTEAFEKAPQTGLVYGRAHLIDGQGQRIGEHLRNHHPPSDALSALLIDNYILIQTVMVKRSALDCVGGFRRFLGEDIDLYLRLTIAGIAFQFIDQPLAEYRKLPGTMSSNKLSYAAAMLAMLERNLASFPPQRSHLFYTAFYHYRVGRAALELRDYGRAEQEFRLALRGRPGQPHFWVYWISAKFPNLFAPLLKHAQRVKRFLAQGLVRLGWRENRWGTPEPPQAL